MLYQFKPWMAVLLLAATPKLQADACKNKTPSYNQGHEASSCDMGSAYSAPACIVLEDESFDLYGTASFIYWQARQENMEIGLISKNDAEFFAPPLVGNDPFDTAYVNNMSITSPNFTFRPGFKIGIGARLGWDGWDAFAEYTRFHQTISSGVRSLPRSTAPLGSNHPNGEYLYPILGHPSADSSLLSTFSGLPYFFNNANQSWTLKMDFVDLSLARAYYSGTKLTVRPFLGVRGAWIRQNLTTSYNGTPVYLVSQGQRNTRVSTFYSSWGIGPRAGFESNWLIGRGFRFIGNGAADILYTRYHLHSGQKSYDLTPTPGDNPIDANYTVSQEIDYLRTHLDFEMGFGWGTYFDHNRYHVDLSATYGFQAFWGQNMFRNFENIDAPAVSFAPNGDLFVHGLTASARFDF